MDTLRIAPPPAAPHPAAVLHSDEYRDLARKVRVLFWASLGFESFAQENLLIDPTPDIEALFWQAQAVHEALRRFEAAVEGRPEA